MSALLDRLAAFLASLRAALRDALADWRDVGWTDVELGAASGAMLMLASIAACALLFALLRRAFVHRAARGRLAIPALLPSMRPGGFARRLAPLRHAPLICWLAGVPCFAIALADPFVAFTHRETSQAGRRIAVMIDASTSMNQPFVSATLNREGGPAYFATVAAAEYFMRLRMEGPHRDLISLIEFGNEAYVVTPFTTDYENVLLSMRLIAEPGEWGRFPDQGTVIIQAIQQATRLFEAFDFADASGNLMVIFSDGQDTQTLLNGRSIDTIMAEALRHRIPVYFVRMAYNESAGNLLPDEIWQAAVEKTGGKFYAGADEATILEAVHEIDRLEPGRIDRREYVVRRPLYAVPLLSACALWLAAGTLKLLGPRRFRSIP